LSVRGLWAFLNVQLVRVGEGCNLLVGRHLNLRTRRAQLIEVFCNLLLGEAAVVNLCDVMAYFVPLVSSSCCLCSAQPPLVGPLRSARLVPC
jgi:hypothetical protein